MSEACWYFTTVGNRIELRARFEGDDGLIGDAYERVSPGGSFHGISYAALKKAKAGTVRITDGGEAVLGP
jgi:hypothetical protein